MNLFYCTGILDSQATLSPEESVHCIRVLRMKRGDQLNIIDGKGHLFEGYIQDPDASECRIIITRTELMPVPRKSKLHIAIAPTKNTDRFEWFVEKSVELGIDSIVPVICERSERKVLKTDRLEKIIISSMKQANIFYKPEIREAVALKKYLESCSGQEGSFIAHCNEGQKFSLKTIELSATEINFLIGPEGDFSMTEVEMAIESGFLPVTLGPNRLRTETAGIFACSIINMRIGKM